MRYVEAAPIFYYSDFKSKLKFEFELEPDFIFL